jgi:hypothetical protein
MAEVRPIEKGDLEIKDKTCIGILTAAGTVTRKCAAGNFSAKTIETEWFSGSEELSTELAAMTDHPTEKIYHDDVKITCRECNTCSVTPLHAALTPRPAFSRFSTTPHPATPNTSASRLMKAAANTSACNLLPSSGEKPCVVAVFHLKYCLFVACRLGWDSPASRLVASFTETQKRPKRGGRGCRAAGVWCGLCE